MLRMWYIGQFGQNRQHFFGHAVVFWVIWTN